MNNVERRFEAAYGEWLVSLVHAGEVNRVLKELNSHPLRLQQSAIAERLLLRGWEAIEADAVARNEPLLRSVRNRMRGRSHDHGQPL